MCWPRKTIPTNQEGQATRLWVCHCQSIQIRVFHITWFTFWLCFFGWFATANLYVQISQDLKISDVEKAIAGGCSVASTVLFRVFVGWLTDKIGARKAYPLLLVASAFPICAMAVVQTPTGYIITSLFIGMVGASFVITNVHIIAMFAGKVVGTANATATGWGNFGGGCAASLMPLLYTGLKNGFDLSNSEAWRYAMLVPGFSLFFVAIVYYVFTVDKPPPPKSESFIKQSNDPQIENGGINDPTMNKKADKSAGGFKVGASDYRTWILFAVYAACFGIELTVLRFCISYFMDVFGLEQAVAGLVILCFSFCNLFARSIGGIIADVVSRYTEESLPGRTKSLFIILMFQGVFLVLFSLSELVGLGYAIFMLVMFSLGVQAAEGATFAIVPFVQPKAVGPVAGIVGAGGNMGAMLYAFLIFTQVPHNLSYLGAWLILGILVFIVGLSVLTIKFSPEEIKNADATMNTWVEMDADQNKTTNEAAGGDSQQDKTQIEADI